VAILHNLQTILHDLPTALHNLGAILHNLQAILHNLGAVLYGLKEADTVSSHFVLAGLRVSLVTEPAYKGTSRTRKNTLLGLYCRPMPRVLGGS